MTEDPFEGVRTIEVDGAKLALREQGLGEPVVFVHGSLSDLRTWDAQLPVLGRSWRAIAYSRRFARPNEDIPPGADDPMLPHVEDLVALLRAIDAAPAHLVGNSWGAFIALLAAIRHPDAVRTLVLEEPPVVPLVAKGATPGPRDLLRLLVTRPRTATALVRAVSGAFAPAQQAFRSGRDEEALRIFVRGVGGEGMWAGLPEARREQMRENLATLRAQLLGEGFPPLSEDDVRGIRAPTLLLTGAHSPAFLLRLSDRLEELLPRVAHREIPDASHGMHEENPDAVNEAILDFLGDHRGAP